MENKEIHEELYKCDDLQFKTGTFLIANKYLNEIDYVIIDNKAIFQGDIILGNAEEIEKKQKINGAIRVGKPWPDYNRIPYKNICILNRDMIDNAIKEIETKTNIKFCVKTDSDDDYIQIKHELNRPGGESYVGYKTGIQFVNLSRDGLFSTRTVIHELCHALGLWHEHSREDRDKFIQIIDTNIDLPDQQKRVNFGKLTDLEALNCGTYDYYSIMHYSQYAFGKRNTLTGKKAITIRCTKDPSAQNKIGQCKNLSSTDILTLNTLANK